MTNFDPKIRISHVIPFSLSYPKPEKEPTEQELQVFRKMLDAYLKGFEPIESYNTRLNRQIQEKV